MEGRKRRREQQKIAREIRMLHRAGEALNISAVKRRHPHLLKRAFAFKPFWGWRRALEASGLDYKKIRVELEETVDCKLCGGAFAMLGTHLPVVHDMSSAVYLKKFPGAKLLSEERCARQMGVTSRAYRKKVWRLMPDWEPLWTPEYVLDRISRLHEAGIPVNHAHVARREISLSVAAYKYFGGWTAALRAAGLNPDEIVKNVRGLIPDRKTLKAAILDRHRRGLPLNSRGVKEGEHRNDLLRARAFEFYGSWPAALRAAGLDAKRIVQMRPMRFSTAQDVIVEILNRKKKGLPLSVSDLQRTESRDHDATLLANGQTYFGSWDKALLAAGLDPATIRKRRPNGLFSSRALILAEIRRRQQLHLPLNTRGVVAGPHRQNAMFAQAIKHFGSWQNALRAAGLDPAAIRRPNAVPRYPDGPSVLAEIKRRRSRGLRINASAMYRGNHQDHGLWNSARKFFGSWANALRALERSAAP